MKPLKIRLLEMVCIVFFAHFFLQQPFLILQYNPEFVVLCGKDIFKFVQTIQAKTQESRAPRDTAGSLGRWGWQ